MRAAKTGMSLRIAPAMDFERAFRDTFAILQRRIDLFLALALSSIDRMALNCEFDQIGQ